MRLLAWVRWVVCFGGSDALGQVVAWIEAHYEVEVVSIWFAAFSACAPKFSKLEAEAVDESVHEIRVF